MEEKFNARYSLASDYDSNIYCNLEDIEGLLQRITTENSFADKLREFQSVRNIPTAELYKRANLDKSSYSKIMGNPEYSVSFDTAVSYAIALGLNLSEAQELLKTAGYQLKDSSVRDAVIAACLFNRVNRVVDVNIRLEEAHLPLIGKAKKQI